MLEGGLMEDMAESKPSAYVCAYLSLTNFLNQGMKHTTYY